MLTPKEKAIELFNKFNNPDKTNYPYIHNAQQCALIAVSEILDVCLPCYSSQKEFNEFINYWIEVKQEIEKL